MTQPFRHRFNAMTTHCEVQCYGLAPDRAHRLVQAMMARVEGLVLKYNFHAPDSWLNRVINGREQAQVEVDEECATVLAIVRRHSAQTLGTFDITVGTLAAARKQARTLAEAHALQQALTPYTGLERWDLHDRTLRFDNPHTRFDLGGVIKEYAVDLCLAMARDAGADAALVNFGGDLHCFGLKPDGSRFVAAVQDPTQPDRMLFALDLENQALTTSGHYARRRVLSDGELSHVIARCGENAPEQAWQSATVVSHSALVSGIYSTSLLLNPSTPLPAEVFAVAVDTQRRIHQLSGPTFTP